MVNEEAIITKVTPRPIAMAFSTLFVTASAEQIPKTAMTIGLFLEMPSLIILKDLVYFIRINFIRFTPILLLTQPSGFGAGIVIIN